MVEMRPQNCLLTAEMLKEEGFQSVEWSDDENTWIIVRLSPMKGRKKQLGLHKLRPGTRLNYKPKYVNERPSQVIGFRSMITGENKILPLGKFLWAWFYGEVKENERVTFANGNALDSRIENLQLIDVAEMYSRRFN